ncbi:hypothetical protein ABI59_23570 [Acidobacteria bacterium Mor1]|nr:hypothetical protein ABI59_23570 [Acidobacteria bacterium Mor1]
MVARVSSVALALLAAGIWFAAGTPSWPAPIVGIVAGAALHRLLTRKLRRRREILAQPFPAAWEAVLQKEIPFFRALESDAQADFRRQIQVFIGEKRITGIGMELDATTRVLTAASAVIPIFGFPEWEWDEIREVLIYPERFSTDFSMGQGHRTLGMVGTGSMNGMMILARPDLLQGFRNPGDKRNVGLHEFAHLVDKTDGTIDGVPHAGLEGEAVRPWIDLMRRKMLEIEQGDSDIDPYALTNEAEFFAVTTEYFFERPGVMQRKHPQLYGMLEGIFQQELGARALRISKEVLAGGKRFGRNSPCPCGSGKKYKRCCLKKV